MKKMVCEICGSQSIRKENGIFVCQECGTEYTVEDARKLLNETEDKQCDDNEESLIEISSQKTDVSGKQNLINILYLWALNLSKMPNSLTWFDLEEYSTLSSTFWTETILEVINRERAPKFDNITPEAIMPKTKTFIHDYISHRFYNNVPLAEELQNRISSTCGYAAFERLIAANGGQYSFKPYGVETGISEYFDKRSSSKKRIIAEMAELYSLKEKGFSKDTSFALYGYKTTIFLTQKRVFAPIDVQSKFENAFRKSYQSVVDFSKQHNELMKCYLFNYNDVCDAVKVIYENCKELEKQLFLPYKYRRIQTILDLIDIVQDGKATNWKDLANLYDTHQFRAGVYEKLDAINSKLDNIQSTLIAGFTTVIKGIANMQNELSSINNKMKLVYNEVSKIKSYSFITMWNSL